MKAAPARGLLLAALVAGGSFLLPVWEGWQGPAVVAWKGAGVALLALWALRQARSADGRVIAAVLACGAAGDVLLEVAGLVPGALAFLLGHVLAIRLYRRHAARGWPLVAGAGLLVAVASGLLASDLGVALYALALGAMAGAASASRFPAAVAAGAWMFVASDLLIFARLGAVAEGRAVDLAVWGLYFAGQALIAHGVVTSLRRDDHLHHRL